MYPQPGYYGAFPMMPARVPDAFDQRHWTCSQHPLPNGQRAIYKHDSRCTFKNENVEAGPGYAPMARLPVAMPAPMPPLRPLLIQERVGQGIGAPGPGEVVVQDDPVGFFRGVPSILLAGIVAGAAFAIGSGIANRYIWKK